MHEFSVPSTFTSISVLFSHLALFCENKSRINPNNLMRHFAKEMLVAINPSRIVDFDFKIYGERNEFRSAYIWKELKLMSLLKHDTKKKI